MDRKPVRFEIERIEDGWLITSGWSMTFQRRWHAADDSALTYFIANALDLGLPE